MSLNALSASTSTTSPNSATAQFSHFSSSPSASTLVCVAALSHSTRFKFVCLAPQILTRSIHFGLPRLKHSLSQMILRSIFGQGSP